MNKIHKVIWSANLGVWVAVSELVKGKKKSSTSSQVADHSHTTKQHHSYLKKIQLASVFLALAALTPSVYAGIQIGKGDYFTGNRPNLGTFMGDDITADGDIRGKSIIANETVNSVDGNFLGTLTSKNGEFTNVTVHKDSFFEGTVNADNGIVIGRSYEDPDRTRLLQGSLTIDTVTKDGENNIYTRTQLDKNGLTLKNGPSVTLSGVDAGNAKVTNVEDGDVTQDSKQAVNGSQLYAAINDSKNLYNALAERAGGNIRVQAGENSGFKDIGLGDTLRFEAGNNTSVRVTPEGYLEYSVADEPTFTNLHVNGTTTSNSLEVTGNATVGERLFVNDTAVVNKELHVTGGDAFFGEDENGSFTHIQKDNIIVQNPKTDGSNGFYRTETADDYFGVYDVNNDAKTVSQATVTPHFLYVADKANGAEDRAQLDNSGLKFYSTDADGNLAATGPDITRDGLNAGNLKVTNVAPGAIATDSTDGINGSQLFGLGNSAATVLGEGVTFENGQLVGKDIGGTGADTIVGAIAAANKAAGTAGQGWKLNVDEGFLGSKKSANIAPGSEVNLVSGKNISAFLKEGNTVELNLNDSVQVSSLGVDEKLGVDGAIDAGGNITTDSSITAKKDITAKRNLSVEGNAIIDGGLTAFGPTALSSTLTVTGQSTFNDAIVRKNLNVNGDSIFKGNSLVNGFMRVEGDSGLFVGKSLDDPRGSAQVKPGVIVVDKVNENGGRARTEVASDYIGSYDLDANDAKTKSSVLSPNNLVLNQTNTENGEINEVSLSGQQMKMSQADAEGNPLKWTIQNPGAITNIDQTAEDGSYTFAGMSATNFVTQKVAKDGSVLAQSGVRPERIWTQSPTEAGSFEGINLTKDGLGFYNESTGEEGGPSQVRTGPFIGREGISAGEFKIADVADGEVSETSKDAINGSQLFASTNALSDRTDDLAKALAATTNSVGDLGASAANVLGDGVTFENGQLVGNDIGGTGANTIVDAIAAANKAAGTAGQGWKLNVADGDSVNIAPGSNVNFTAGKNLTVSLNEGNNVEYGLVSKPVVERLTIQSATAETDKVTQVADLDRATFHLTQYTHPQNGSKDKVVSTDISPGRFSTTDYRQNKGVELSQYGLKFFEVNPENNSTIYDGTRVTSKAILMGKDDGRPYTSISPEYFISRSNNKEGITVSHENGSDFAKIGSYLRDENGKIIERYTSSGFTNDRIYSWNQKKGVGTEIDPDRITFFEATGPEKTTYRGTVIDHSGIKIPSNDGQNYLVQNSKNLVIRSNNPEGVNKTNELGSDFNRIATFTQTEDGQINFQNLTAQTPDEFYTFDYKANEGTKLDAEGLGFYSKDADNHRISQGPSVTRTGIDAGELKVTNVADGEVSEASKDAVNGSQLFASTNALSDRTDDLAKALAATTNSVGDLGASAANVLGEGVTYQDGKLVGDNIGGTGANTITGAIQAASEAASDAAANAAKGWNVVAGDAEAQNVAPDDTVNFTAGSNLNVALNDGHNVEYGLNPNLVGLNSAQFGDENASTIVDGKGLVFAAKNEAGETVPVGPSISKDGIDAGNTKVTNLADADITADSTDAVSGHQLFTATDALAQRDQQLAQRDNDLGNSTAGVLGEGVTYQDGKLVGNDIGGTGANTITGAIQAASEAASDAAANAAKGWNVVAGDAEAQNVAPDDTVNFTAGSNLNVALNDGHNVEYGLNPNLVGLNSAQFGDDNASTIVDGKGLLFAAKNEAGETVPVGPSISKDGIDAGNTKVTNLAEADITADSKDAVSGGQLFAATDALAQRDQELAQRDNDLAAGLGDLGASTAGVLGDGVTYQDGKLVGDNIGGTGANTITGAIQAASEAASDAAANAAKGWNVVAGDAEAQNVAPDDTVNFTAGSNLNVALNDGHNVEYGLNPNLVGLNSAQFGDENASTIVDGKGLLFAAKNEAGETVPVGPSISKDGIDAGNTKVTNLAEADITADSKDAVSGGQLFAATDALAQRDQELAQRDNDLAAGLGDLGASTAGVLGDGVTYQDGKLVGDNIGGTGANTITGAIQAASEAASDAAANAAKGWNVAVGETNQNVAPDDTVNFTAGSNLNVALNDGHNVEYGLNPNLVGLNSAQFGDENASTIVDGKGLLFAAKNEAGETVPVGPSISKDGIDAGNTKVTNLADADITADSKDAVSGGQLFAATDALAQRDQELAQRDKDLA
ncbi:ESPR-type extended signal peptide-containing protein, partial [Brackiella oedipodis]|uniref:ESPR-type extended signal peptide-containing protein n=1 Tax=Brackiella oedipodis TaxID=124225 RepID=UPI000572058C